MQWFLRYAGLCAIAVALVWGWFWWTKPAVVPPRLAATVTGPFEGTPTPSPAPAHKAAPVPHKTVVVQPKTVVVQPKTVVVQPKTVVVQPKTVVTQPKTHTVAAPPGVTCESVSLSKPTATLYRVTVHARANGAMIGGYVFTTNSATQASTNADHPYTDFEPQSVEQVVQAQVQTTDLRTTPYSSACTVTIPAVGVGQVQGVSTTAPAAAAPVVPPQPATVPDVGGTAIDTSAVSCTMTVTQQSATLQRFWVQGTAPAGTISGYRFTFSDSPSTATVDAGHPYTDKTMTGRPVKAQAQVLLKNGFVSPLNDTCAVSTEGKAVSGTAPPAAAAPPVSPPDSAAPAPATTVPATGSTQVQTMPATGTTAGGVAGLVVLGLAARSYWYSKRSLRTSIRTVDKSRP
jgi:hypothetical protein